MKSSPSQRSNTSRVETGTRGLTSSAQAPEIAGRASRTSESPAPLPRALFAVVNDQLSAVRAADYASAYAYAANGMQQKFTLPQFERMFRRNYPHIAQSLFNLGMLYSDTNRPDEAVRLRNRLTELGQSQATAL